MVMSSCSGEIQGISTDDGLEQLPLGLGERAEAVPGEPAEFKGRGRCGHRHHSPISLVERTVAMGILARIQDHHNWAPSAAVIGPVPRRGEPSRTGACAAHRPPEPVRLGGQRQGSPQ